MKWVNGLIFGVGLLGIASMVHADLNDLLDKFHPYISVQEEYSSNINLSNSILDPAIKKTDDFITTISPGVRFSTLPRLDETLPPGFDIPTPPRLETIRQIPEPPTVTEKYGIDLDYRLGLVFYAKEEDNNYVRQEGTLNTWYTVGGNLTFSVREYLIRSEEPREREFTAGALPDQFLLGTQRERAVYFRNVFEPSVEYRFGAEDRITMSYRSNYYDNQSRLFPDSREDFINPKLTYWFNVKNGVFVEYGLLFGDFEQSPDLLGHAPRARYIHRIDPRTSLFGEHIFLSRNFESPGIDYHVNAPSLGIEHVLSPTTYGRAQLGYFWQDPGRGSRMTGPLYDILLVKRAEKTTYLLSFNGGFREDFFTAENLGFAKYHRGIGTVTHRLKQRLLLAVSGTAERARFADSRTDWIWGVRGGVTYQILKWLNATLETGYREDHSNNDVFDYNEYRGIFRITATF